MTQSPATHAPPTHAHTPTPAPVPGSGERWDICMRLARMLLMVGPDDRDLTREYLRVLIDEGLQRPRAPKRVLVVGAGIAGLVAAWLLRDAGHQVTVVEANASRVGGRLKTFRAERGAEPPFSDPRQYAEAGAMRLPDFHPLVLALTDKLGLRRRLFFNVDVDPATGNQTAPVPAVVYRPFDGSPEWRRGPDHTDFQSPKKLSLTWIRTNGTRIRKADYAADPGRINAGFEVPESQRGTPVGDLLNAVLDPVRDYYSFVVDGKRKNRPFREWLEGWARLIFDLDEFSMRRFLRERAGLGDETIEAIGTIENLTSRLSLAFFHSFLGRSDINPAATYWEIDGGSWRLPEEVRKRVTEGDPEDRPTIRMDRRMIRMEYWSPDRPCRQCTHVGPDGPRVWIETVNEAGDVTEEFSADCAIVTIPFSSLRHVVVDPLFSYKKRRSIIELHYDSATKVLLEFSRRWWEFTDEDWKRELDAIEPGLHERYQEDAAAGGGTSLLGAHPSVDDAEVPGGTREWYGRFRNRTARPRVEPDHFFGGGSISDNPNRFMYYPSHPVEGSPGGVVLAAYTWADDAARWDSMDDDERYAFALRGLVSVHGERIVHFYTGHGQTQSWMRNPYAFGEAAVFLPGQLTQFHLDIPTPEGPVHFAGEHTSLKHAWVEGALESAVRAALEVNGGA